MATVIAPLLGAGLLVWFSWRAIFLAMALLGSIAALYALTLFQETAGARRPERFSLSYVAQSARYLLARPAFTGPVAILGLTFAGYAAIGAVGAVTAETQFGIDPGQYGALFALAAITNTIVALIARRLLKSLLPSRVNAIGIGFLALAGLVHLALIFVAPGLALFWASVCLYVFAFGMVLPLSFALAMEPAGNMPGFAAALTGATYMVLGTLAVLLATNLFDGSHRAISLTMALCAGLAATVWAIGRFSRNADAPEN